MNLDSSEPADSKPRVPAKHAIIGLGGGGGNIVAHIAQQEIGNTDVFVANTDAQALATLPVEQQLLLGEQCTRGLGAGGDPERGRTAAEESIEALRDCLSGRDLVFVVAGMGGGTGTGSAPVVARIAREAGALVLAVVTLPFDFEGVRRRFQATDGINRLRAEADGVIVVPNQKVLTLVPDNAPIPECFGLIHDYLLEGVRGIVGLVDEPGTINVDFADLRSVLTGTNGASALAHVTSSGVDHAAELMKQLHQHPLLDEGQILAAASSLLVSLRCGAEVGLQEVHQIMTELQTKAPAANLNLGMMVDDGLGNRVSLTVVVGLEAEGDGMEPASHPVKRKSRRGGRDSTAAGQEVFVRDDEPEESTKARFVPPPPELSPTEAVNIMKNESGRGRPPKRKLNKFLQGQLPLEIVSTGRFEKSEPTLHDGENLDEPTYIRRGAVLN